MAACDLHAAEIQLRLMGFLDTADIRTLTQLQLFRETSLNVLLRHVDDVAQYMEILSNDRSSLPTRGHDRCLVRVASAYMQNSLTFVTRDGRTLLCPTSQTGGSDSLSMQSAYAN